MGIINKSNLVLFGVIITAVLVIGGFTTNMVFALEDQTKLMKKCSKEKNQNKIECQILMIILEIKAIIENNKETYPPVGSDGYSLIAELTISTPDGAFDIATTGNTIVQRSDPYEDDPTGKWTIDTEIISMELTGDFPAVDGPIIFRQSSSQQSLGNIQQQIPGGEDFPADSFFDIFLEIELPTLPPESGVVQPLRNVDPIHVEINQGNPLMSIPPLGNLYEQEGCVDIFTSNDPPFPIIQLCDLKLIPATPTEEEIKSELIVLLSGLTTVDEIGDESVPIFNQASCEDGDACTVNDFFEDSQCVSGPTPSCDDANLCTVGSCDSGVGCVYELVSCDDFNQCTTDSCNQLGGCFNQPRSCDDSNLCTVDSCDAQTGCTNDEIDCDDGLACTAEACVGDTGLCEGGILVNNCVIDNTCYANDDVNPANECEFCRADLTPGENIRDWSDVADGTSCNGGSGICSSGVCI